MVAAGLPEPQPLHGQKNADMALDVHAVMKSKFLLKFNRKVRIGIHTGRAVAGVIGNKKFSNDLGGESINIASRFEVNGQVESIHITEAVKSQ